MKVFRCSECYREHYCKDNINTCFCPSCLCEMQQISEDARIISYFKEVESRC